MFTRSFLRDNAHLFWLALLALAIPVGWYFLDGDLGVNFADEGYLWYGVEAVLRGLVPIRDFQSYDPGRYWWAAVWSLVLGKGLMPLRLSCALFASLGIFAGLLAARRVCRRLEFLLGMGLLLAAWMHPRYKCFEQSIALMFVYAGVLLIEKPSLAPAFLRRRLRWADGLHRPESRRLFDTRDWAARGLAGLGRSLGQLAAPRGFMDGGHVRGLLAAMD